MRSSAILGYPVVTREEYQREKQRGVCVENYRSLDIDQLFRLSHSYARSALDGERQRETPLRAERFPSKRSYDTQLLTQLQSLSVSRRNTVHDGSSSLLGAPQFYSNYPHSESDDGASVVAGGNGSQWAWSRGYHGNCRGEALVVGYVDDVTVEDLTGYFDQMLHLPKPMSDMVHLMYT